MSTETPATAQAPASDLAWTDLDACRSASPTRRYATLTFMRGAFLSLAITTVMGLLAVAYYLVDLAAPMQSLGLDLRSLRPLHSTFAAAWIFLAGMTAVHRYLQDVGDGPTTAERWRLRMQVLLWAIAGAGILVSLPLGLTSGREYLGFHPAISALILAGWLCFAWNFFSAVGKDFWSRPVYVTMWGVATLFFIYTVLEQHAWMLPDVFSDPIVDKRIQWKATGTLVGAMNLFVYGSVIYLGEKLSRDRSYGQSKVAYALFGVGLLNSFTNFAHHTYHLPQNHLVKQISFVVSMFELVIFFHVLGKVLEMVRQRESRAACCARALLTASRWWTAAMLISSVLISVPVLNSFVHGTLLVAGHAMGTMIGIDTIAMLGVLAALLAERMGARDGAEAAGSTNCPVTRGGVLLLNVSAASLVGWLHFVGIVDGWHRYRQPAGAAYIRPEWLAGPMPVVFAITGTALFAGFAVLLIRWSPLAFQRFRGFDDCPDRALPKS
jgi:nitric oxide reductase subunit B